MFASTCKFRPGGLALAFEAISVIAFYQLAGRCESVRTDTEVLKKDVNETLPLTIPTSSSRSAILPSTSV